MAAGNSGRGIVYTSSDSGSFEIRHPFNEYRPFQVMPDGETFLTVQLEQEIRGGHLTVIQNWEGMLPPR